MAGSTSTTRWILGAAAACALLGLLLRTSGEDEATSPAGSRAREQAARRAGVPGAEGDRLASVRPGETPGGIGEGEGEHPAGGSGLFAPGSDPEHLKLPRLPVPRTLGGERVDSARERRRARKRERDLRAGRTGDDAGGIPAGGAPIGTGRAPGEPAPRDPQKPATPPPAETAYQSEEDTQYQLDAQVDIPDVGKIANGAGTLSFWLQPQWQDGNQDDATLMEIGDGRLQVIKNVNFIRFEYVDDAGTIHGLGTSITDWKAGEWHQVAVTWSGNRISLFTDGALRSEKVNPFAIQFPPDTPLHIGSNYPESRPVAPGVIAGVDLHGRPMGANEIARRFTRAGS